MSEKTGGEGSNGDATENERPVADQDGSDDETLRAEGVRALKREQESRKAAEKRAGELETRLKAIEDKDKGDAERLTSERDALAKKLDETERRVKDANARGVITDLAVKANAVSAAGVYALVRDRVEFDADGNPTNAAELIADAKKSEPGMFSKSAGPGDGGAGNEVETKAEVTPGYGRLVEAYAKKDEQKKRRG